MLLKIRRSAIILTSLALAVTAYHCLRPLPPSPAFSADLTIRFLRSSTNCDARPPAIKDIALVVIDNYTLKNMPGAGPIREEPSRRS